VVAEVLVAAVLIARIAATKSSPHIFACCSTVSVGLSM